MSISKCTLKPKYHFLLHYGHLLLKNGPLILTSSIRFEAKHKTIKAMANAIPCRINLGHTLSHKIQLQMINRFLSRTGLQPDLKFSSSSFNEDYSNYLFDLPTEFECNSFSPTWLEYKGIKV